MTSSLTVSSTTKSLLIGLSIGTLATLLIASQLGLPFFNNETDASDLQSDEKAPLYWVAPMDDSYRRDKPGKSPMGMDLVPVYASDTTQSEDNTERTPGTVMIPSNVQQNMGVKIEPVRVGTLEQEISALGTVAYDEDSIVHIHPRVEGWVDTLFIKSQGEQVDKGQALYTLYSPELVSAQEEYVLALKRGDARLIDGAAERLKTLGLSKPVIDNLKTSRRISQTVTFHAPQRGVVEALNIREGFYVQPGTTMMSIAQLDTVWVIAEVPEKYAQVISLHDSAFVSLDELAHTSSATWESHVEYIYPSLSKTTRTLKLRIPLNNHHQSLKPNMFTQVLLRPAKRSAALLVPHSAVIRTAQGAKVVQSDGNGNFKSVSVKLGQSDSRHFEVLEGVLPGDEVVVSAQFLIDSESSKNSDFTRMKAPNHQATTTGTIEAIKRPDAQSADNVEMTIARGPIEKWGRGPAVMDFAVSQHIDVSNFNVGDSVVFTFVTGEKFTVIDMRRRAKSAAMPSETMPHEMRHGEHEATSGHNSESGPQREGNSDTKAMNHKEHMHHD